MSILKGKGAKMEFTGITFAGKGQNLDTGAKVVHAAPDTTSYINTKSISKDGGISTFRSSVVVNKNAEGAKSSVSCESLMLDAESQSDTIPAIDVRTRKADVGSARSATRRYSISCPEGSAKRMPEPASSAVSQTMFPRNCRWNMRSK